MKTEFIPISANKKIYVASDFHLGAPNNFESIKREKLIIKWLTKIQGSASEIILAGDIFDFWFEYTNAIPKGAVRLLGKLASLSDDGVVITIFTGNHDLWMRDYLEKEIGAKIFHKPQSFEIGKMRIMIGHGDGLGPGKNGFRFIKKIFSSRINQFLFKWLHPDIGIAIANKWSSKSRMRCMSAPDPFLGEDEPIFQYCRSVESQQHHDYYIFGHRHLQLEMPINDHSIYLNLGEWISLYTYAEIDGSSVTMKKYDD